MPSIYDYLDKGQPQNNPFSSVLSSAPQSDPWAGLRSMGGGGGAAPMAPQGGASSRLPGYNPIADPQGPLARSGWIGSLIAGTMGGPTRQEAMMQQAGGATQAAIQQIGQRIQAGIPPQRAIMDFVGTPEGQQFFASGGGMTDIANMVKGLTPPGPETVKLSPGEVVAQVSPDGSVRETFRSPTTKVQEFQNMAELGGLTRDEQSALARATLMKDANGDVSEQQQALNSLVSRGRMSQETAEMIRAGVLKVQPVLDASGSTVGHAVVDISQGGSRIQLLGAANTEPGQVPGPGNPSFVPGVTPGTRAEDNIAQDNAPLYQGLQNPADIVDSAGPVGWLFERVGSILGNIDPNLAAQGTVQNRKALGNIRADAMMMAKDGRVLASEMKEIASLADTLGMFNSPISTTQTLINLHDRYDNMERSLNTILSDPNTTGKVRGDAYVDLANIRRAKANLPTRDSLTSKLDVLNQQQPMENLERQVGEEVDAANRTLGNTAAPAQPDVGMTFNSPDEVRKAWREGRIKKGMVIILNGKRHEVTKDFGGE